MLKMVTVKEADLTVKLFIRILLICSSSWVSALWLEHAFFDSASPFWLTVSPQRLTFFGFAVLFYAACWLILPYRIRQQHSYTIPLAQNLRELWSRRDLVRLWLRYRIEARYAQTVLGILWVVLLPLSTSLVLAFAFTQFTGHPGTIDEISYVAFLLAGLAMFEVGRSIILRAQGMLMSMVHIMSRVYFPREIILLVLVGEVLVDFTFTFAAMVLINALFFQIYPNLYYIFVPLILAIMVGFALGIAFIVGWYGLVINDLQQLLTIIMQLLFYLTVLFSRGDASSLAITLLHFNPMALILEAFRDVVLFARLPNMLNLTFTTVLSLTLLYLGYTIFKANENRFVEVM
jgi:lipopolysaccharide transport system permease protein